MTDDPLDDLKQLMGQATPAPNSARKAQTLAQAEKIFEGLQGSANPPRLTSDRPFWTGISTGVKQMFAKLTSHPGLTATTAIVAVGLVALVPILNEGPPDYGFTGSPEVQPELVDAISQDRAALGRDADNRQQDDVLPMEAAPVITAEESEAVPERPLAKVAPSPLAEGRITGAELGTLAETDGSGLNFAPQAIIDGEAALIVTENNTEAFSSEEPASVKVVLEEPVSTFSIDVDTASYSVVRSSIMNGFLPPAEAVRIEEMINYFPYDYTAPAPGEGPFTPTVSITPTPWNPDTQLMHIAIQGELPQVEDRPPLNLVFLIDTSGSMDQQNKLPLLKQSFRLMLGQLSDQDQVSIVTYAGSAGRVLDPTAASERSKILAALDRMDAGGSTAGQAGLQQAYATAEEMAQEGEVTRVILATDGDFNVGLSDPDALKNYIADKRDSGTYLSVLGFGRGNLDDATMQALAQNGNGTAAYIDTLSEAQKVLVDQLSGALFPIANDVKIQVEFNPNLIAEYRLIGYETRALNREDFNNDKVDAGEIGAGHSVTALYELTPIGSPAVLNDPLRYSTNFDGEVANDDEYAYLRLRYKEPGESSSKLVQVPITPNMDQVGAEAGFAAAIAGFGQLLQDSTYIGDWTYSDAIAFAEANTGADPFGYRREAVQLMRLAQSLSN